LKNFEISLIFEKINFSNFEFLIFINFVTCLKKEILNERIQDGEVGGILTFLDFEKMMK